MAKILYVSTHGTDDPSRAAIPFVAATGATEAGHEPTVALLLESTYVLKEGVADTIVGVGFPPLNEVLSGVIANKTPIYV